MRSCKIGLVQTVVVEDKMEMLVPGSVEECDGRKFIYDGMLTKLTHKGKKLTYRVDLRGLADV